MSKEDAKMNNNKRFWIFLAVFAIVCILLRLFVFEFFRVSGESMIPTFKDGDCVFAEKISVYTKDISYGDIVIVEYPDGLPCIKRVIGIEGDTIEIKNGLLIKNDQSIRENYINEDMIGSISPITVNEDMIFVMGDNRNDSNDSRNPSIGTIHYNEIKGKVRFIIFPFEKIRRMN